MPTVGSKKFPYTPSGEMAAAMEAKATGKKMVKKPMKPMKPKKKKVGFGGMN